MAAPEISQGLLATLLDQITADPGLPRENYTVPAWHDPPHTLAEVQSKTLPDRTDFAIIGSGITGCSVAKTLLEHDSSSKQSVTVFEARRLTTGATSRNGGFLMGHAASGFAGFVKAYGPDNAAQIAYFCDRTIAKIIEVAKAENLYKECQIRDVTTLLTAEGQNGFDRLSESVRLYNQHVPELRDTYLPISKEEAEKKFGVKNITGAFTHQSRVFWPYRLVTGIFQRLLHRYPERFAIETNTPVTSITISRDSDHTHPYILETPRGTVRAKKVFHCTSGFTGHLLPRFRGPVFPSRLSMACAPPGPHFGKHAVSWLWRVPESYNADTKVIEQGLYWMQQNAETGDLFYGGDKAKLDELITADDSTVSVESAKNLETLLPQRIFARGWTDPVTGVSISSLQPHHSWSGILSMTPDHLAIVGPVSPSLSGRQVDGGEWVAAGFNGYGMGQCWSSGEAIARMALGEPKPEWLPQMYLSTEERLTSTHMSPEGALKSFFGRW